MGGTGPEIRATLTWGYAGYWWGVLNGAFRSVPNGMHMEKSNGGTRYQIPNIRVGLLPDPDLATLDKSHAPTDHPRSKSVTF